MLLPCQSSLLPTVSLSIHLPVLQSSLLHADYACFAFVRHWSRLWRRLVGGRRRPQIYGNRSVQLLENVFVFPFGLVWENSGCVRAFSMVRLLTQVPCVPPFHPALLNTNGYEGAQLSIAPTALRIFLIMTCPQLVSACPISMGADNPTGSAACRTMGGLSWSQSLP